MIASARPGKWMYNSSVVTDQDPHALATATVREKLLDLLSDELPYKVDVSVRMWDVDSSGTHNQLSPSVQSIQAHQISMTQHSESA